MTAQYVVATTRAWNIKQFSDRQADWQGEWHLIADPRDLTDDFINAVKPRYVFFPHWSWKIPETIYGTTECVLFHMTDLPYGRGGSPLQNLIVRGNKKTKISAIQVVEELDAGPVYLKKPLSLNGSAQEIFERASGQVFDMIESIVANEPSPVPQSGEVVTFNRRTPDMSALPDAGELDQVYDHIRMLDAEGYPRAFIESGKLRFTFKDAKSGKDCIEAKVRIELKDDRK